MPPETDTDTTDDPAEDRPEETASLPFFDVSGTIQNGVRVRAGYTDGETVDSLAVDVHVGVRQAETAIALAFGWYAERWRELVQANSETNEQRPAEVPEP